MKANLFSCLCFFVIVCSFSTEGYSQESGFANYCSLLGSDNQRQKTILTEAYLYVTEEGDHLFFSPQCNNRDFFSVAEFRIDKVGERFRALTSSAQGSQVFRLKIAGKLSMSLVPRYGQLSFARASITVDKVWKPRRETILLRPDFSSEAPLLDSVESLRVVNSALIFDLFGHPPKYINVDQIRVPTTRLIVNGGSRSYGEARNQLSGMVASTIKITVDTILRIDEQWRMRGRVILVDDQGSERSLAFDNLFSLVPNRSPKLTLARFSFAS
jgi:hypothetical protein